MYFFKAGLSVILAFLLIMLNCATASASSSSVNDEKGTITEHEPKSRTSAAMDMPGKSGNTWLWVLLGAVAIAGGAAAIAGGGGDDNSSSSNSTSSPGDTGSISGSW